MGIIIINKNPWQKETIPGRRKSKSQRRIRRNNLSEQKTED
jgi:hypothetical protein